MKLNNIREIFFCITIISFFLCVLMGEVYRPWIYTNKIDDYGVAGSAVSFLGAITAVFFSLYINIEAPYLKNIFFTGIGCIIYEYLQPFLGLGYFDVNDIIGIILGVFSSLLILYFAKSFFRFENRESKGKELRDPHEFN